MSYHDGVKESEVLGPLLRRDHLRLTGLRRVVVLHPTAQVEREEGSDSCRWEEGRRPTPDDGAVSRSTCADKGGVGTYEQADEGGEGGLAQ